MKSKEEVINEFIEQEELRGYNESTLNLKKRNIQDWIEYLERENKEYTRSSTEDVEGFLIRGFKRDRSEALYNSRVSHLNQLYNFLIEKGEVLLNPCRPLERKRIPENSRDIFTEQEIKRILGPIPDTRNGRRDRAIIELMYSTGMRLNELVNLDLDDINLKEKEIYIGHGKCHKERIVPVGHEALRVLESYLEDRYRIVDGEEEALFLGRDGLRTTKGLVNYIFSKHKKRAGIEKKGNTHSLRHSFASHLLKNGAPVSMIMRMLGHENLYDTVVYTHILKEDLKRIHILAGSRLR